MDSIAYITLDRLIASTGTSGAGFCDACFTGNYPIEIPVTLSKGVLEGGDRATCCGEAAPVPAAGDELFAADGPTTDRASGR